MNRPLSDLAVADHTPTSESQSSPTIGIIALRFVTLLVAIISVFAWAWSK